MTGRVLLRSVIKADVKKTIHSDIFSIHTQVPASGVNIASSVNHQHFNGEVEGVGVALNETAFVHVLGKREEQTLQGGLLHQQKCSAMQ